MPGWTAARHVGFIEACQGSTEVDPFRDQMEPDIAKLPAPGTGLGSRGWING